MPEGAKTGEKVPDKSTGVFCPTLPISAHVVDPRIHVGRKQGLFRQKDCLSQA